MGNIQGHIFKNAIKVILNVHGGSILTLILILGTGTVKKLDFADVSEDHTVSTTRTEVKNVVK
jgi:uncharacterized membrane protein (Fun14 family)